MEAPVLLNPERKMLSVMQSDATKKWSLEEILVACGWKDQAIAVGAGHGLTNHGFVNTEEHVVSTVRLASEGKKAHQDGLLEHRLWAWIQSSENPSMGNLQTAFERNEAGPGVGLLKRLGVGIVDGMFHSADADAVNE